MSFDSSCWQRLAKCVQQEQRNVCGKEIMQSMSYSVRLQSVLVAAGTDANAAEDFVNRVLSPDNATAFLEMYGQGNIVTVADKVKRTLIFKGLQTFDLRASKPDG